ncbi:NADH-ubiquinone oxidoreductase-F iron-sulfur binding region domain-containing protein [Microbacterium sp.]|uniref:NADH-ubiquinone oxidoreductase-F iron-sulfur binding region domain-containing protein n=1 Tax=Microbacterium sp. TaxID=51671 RepID=UPI002735E080|nr:NADH-ubiquinone oxidoreductase-F iron-sulfur binding region domain-containing protein [Microbacterium sp.]MDP3950423.1 NADH-ubiquinone oxidoreductase-F iron-sulfur binding region domain-containing protein [Microbacterium sp.]
MSMSTDVGLSVETGVFPGHTPRLLTTRRREGIEAYLEAGGYRPIEHPAALYEQLELSGLRGHGGAAFPLARKIATVRDAGTAPIVLANGEEGEPVSLKDRWLMRHRPHLVLDGLRLAAAMVGSLESYLYISDEASADSMEAALAEYPGEGWIEFDVTIHRVESSYVAGEETAAVRSIGGGPALPSEKPPRPFESGIKGCPTLVSNVETLANLPIIQQLGGAEFRAVGTEASPGTFLMTLTRSGRVGLFEVPFGVSLRDVLVWLGEGSSTFRGALVGGYFAGLLGTQVLDLALDYPVFSGAGSGLGCGAFALLDEDVCPISVAARVLAYFARNNAGQCGSCFNGTAAMAGVATALGEGRAEPSDVDRLRRWSVDLRGRGACGTLDGATNVAATMLREFPDLVDQHLTGSCAQCISAAGAETSPYAVDVTR